MSAYGSSSFTLWNYYFKLTYKTINCLISNDRIDRMSLTYRPKDLTTQYCAYFLHCSVKNMTVTLCESVVAASICPSSAVVIHRLRDYRRKIKGNTKRDGRSIDKCYPMIIQSKNRFICNTFESLVFTSSLLTNTIATSLLSDYDARSKPRQLTFSHIPT